MTLRTQGGRSWRSAKAVRRRGSRVAFIEQLEPRQVLATAPLISEFLAGNAGGLQDADGDSSDWIEIYNPTAAPVNLQGWSLTDDPGDLNEWVFPSVTIGANSFLTVFASNKDRTGPELHTNFKLSGDGDYLALVNSSGVVVSEYAPSFPAQLDNISYGVAFDTAKLIQPGAAAQVLIPTNGSLGDTWKTTGFTPTGWTSGTTGVGFGIVHPGFNVVYAKANVDVTDLTSARSVLATPAQRTLTLNTTAAVVNYMGNGGGGRYTGDSAFPNQAIGDDINDFVVQANGTVKIPTAGNWTFVVNSDDGFELNLSRGATSFHSEYNGLRGASDTYATFNIPTAGDWNISATMFEHGGGASFEMFAAPGALGSFNASVFDLVGDVASGGLAVSAPIGDGTGVAVGIDTRAAMQNVNATAFVRVPFSATNPAAFDSLQLQMQYDDGFVAFLNGTEVARRNAPGTLSFNSAATADRSLADATTAESINLTPFLNLLQTGANVLAIQGLNSSAADDTFLVLPQLVASTVHTDQLRYFKTPTPGTFNTDPALGVIEGVTASIAAGFYNSPISVTLSTTSPGATIRYTTDGSTPTATNGIVYTTPLAISATTTLRAIAYRTDYLSRATITRSYIFLNDVIVQSPSDDVTGGYPDTGAPPPGWPATWGSNVVDYGMDQTIVNQAGAATVKAALLAMPSMSITTGLTNLFNPTTGIYANPYQDGRDWERDASVELINPDGSAGFQINAGLRIRGGYSRSTDNPKHSFRVFFRSDYGESSLDYPLFGSGAATSFKKFDLRTAQNYSWSFGGDASNTMIQDGFARASQGEMGQLYSHSKWVHLYLDGQYWGIYQIEERPEAEFAASYLGGDADNYDVIKPEAGVYTNYATDGNQEAYQRLWQYVTTENLADNAKYYHLQGKNAAGVNDPGIPNADVLVDVDNLIVYMLGILHGGNLDAPISAFLGNNGINNYFAIRDRTSRSGFRFVQHDAEHTLHNVNEDRNGPFTAGQSFDRFNPQYLHQQLMANSEYRLRFADLVQQFFYSDGPMTAAAAVERFQDDADQLDQAIYGESARWGDAKRPTSPLGRSNWLSAVTTMEGFLTNRNPVLIAQFQGNGLFPTIAAPQYLINGVPQASGDVTPGSQLRLTAPSGLVYYTTNGSDPRLVGGGINPAAQVFDPSSGQNTLFNTGSSWKYRDLGTDLGTAWRGAVYDDSAWSSGNAELGYGEGDEATILGYGSDANNKYITTYFRRTFSVTNASQVTGLKLRLRRDDGAVVYINGVEAARSNMPAGAILASTLASSNVGGTDETTLFEFNLDPALLHTGTNLIAVELHQSVANSSDLSFDASLIATVQSSPALVLNAPTQIQSRTLSGGSWSALSEAIFTTAVVPATATNFAITEVHYNPLAMSGTPAPPLNDEQNFEFLEFRNISTSNIALAGVNFTNGIDFNFSNGNVPFLAPGEFVVLVKNQQAFEARYGTGIRIGGVYDGSISNGGEQLRYVDATGTVIQDFTYDDAPAPWPLTPDGGGPSLVVRSSSGNYNQPGNWRASYLIHGTPGYEENDFPATLTLTGGTVNENLPAGVAGSLSATDPNTNDILTFSLVDDAGGKFVVVASTLRLADGVQLDYEAQSSHNVTVRVTDAGGLSLDKVFTILVNNLIETQRVTTFAATPVGATFTLSAAAAVSGLNLYDYRDGSGNLVLGSSDVQLTNLAGQAIPGSLMIAAGDSQFTFVSTAGALPPDTYALRILSGANAFRTAAGEILDGNVDGVPGGDYTANFTVTAPQANSVTVSLPHFARGPGQAVNVPADQSLGVPLRVSNGAQVRSLTFNLSFDPGLLNITGVTLPAGAPSGSTAVLTSLGSGAVRVTLTYGGALAAGAQTVAYLQADVPTSAASRYGEREVLDISALDLRDGGGLTLPARDQDAVHVNAFVGDAGRNGRYDSFDVQQASRLAVRIDTGFQQHPLLDPVLMADFNGNGRIDSFDVQRLSRLALRLPIAEAPVLPTPLPTMTDTDRVVAEEPQAPEEPKAEVAPVAAVPTPELRSDVDGNGAVDAQDVLWAIYYFNRSTSGELPADAPAMNLDLNGDQQFDPSDILQAVIDLNAAATKNEPLSESPPDAGDSSDDMDALSYLLAEDTIAARKKVASAI